MPYTVLLAQPAERDRRKLPPDIRSRINQALLALEAQPRAPGVIKLAGSDALWRLRLGDYRILFRIDDGHSTVLVLRIAHRREAYR